MPLAGFLPKVASTIAIQILPPKPTQEAPGTTDTAMSKFGSIIFKHKNCNNSESIGSSNLKFSPHHAHTILQNFSSLPPVVQKLSPKRFIFNSFQDPWQGSFQDPKYLQNTELFIHIWKFLSRPLLSAIVVITLFQNASFDHFKTLDLVYFQNHGRWTAHFLASKVWLACRGPATGIWWVEGSDHLSVMSIQH